MTLVRSKKYRDGARGQGCTLRIPTICTGDVETTVFAHIRDSHTGRSIKASDLSGCDACWACHEIFDSRSKTPAGTNLGYEDWFFYALRGLQETLERRVEQGLLRLDIDVPKPFKDRTAKPRKPVEQRQAIPSRPSPMPSRPFQKRAK